MVLKQEIIQNIQKFQRAEISLKKLTSELNKEKEYLLSLYSQNNQTHTEIAYCIYFSPERECNMCQKQMTFQGFKKGYICCKKCETIKRLNKITKEEAIQEIKALYIKLKNPVYGDKHFKSFSQSCRKYLNKFWREESKENWNKCLYDIVYIKSEEKCKYCNNNVSFSSYKFRYSPCCGTSCMTKYQMKELIPWNDERKQRMVKNIKKTKLEKYGNENFNNPKKGYETRVKNSNCLPYNLKPLKDIYYAEVMKHTRKNAKDLENKEKRGRSGVDGKYHLDHKFSIMEGFLSNILPSFIGSKNNLEYIPWEENQKKNKNCSITIEELFCL